MTNIECDKWPHLELCYCGGIPSQDGESAISWIKCSKCARKEGGPISSDDDVFWGWKQGILTWNKNTKSHEKFKQ